MNNTALKYPSEITEEDQSVIFALISLAKSHQCRNAKNLRQLMTERFPEVSDEQFKRCMQQIGRRIMNLEVEQECQTNC